MLTQFAPDHPWRRHDSEPLPPPASNAAIVLNGLQVMGGRGNVLLERTSLSIARPAHVALVGGTGSGRDILAKVLGRQITVFNGSVDIGDQHLAEITDETASRFLAYISADVRLFPGSIRDNIILSLLRVRPTSRKKRIDPKA